MSMSMSSSSSSSSSPQTYQVSIVVYKGDPIDLQQYRHTGLWFVPVESGSESGNGSESGSGSGSGSGNGSGLSHYYFHVVGMTGAYAFETRVDVDPKAAGPFAKQVAVGTTRRPLTARELADHMGAVGVRNADPEFNCQVWVDHAVHRMCRAGYLTDDEYNDGIGRMIDVTLEATDEDSAFF